MTDGVHYAGIDPEVGAASVVSQYEVTISTVTFGIGYEHSIGYGMKQEIERMKFDPPTN